MLLMIANMHRFVHCDGEILWAYKHRSFLPNRFNYQIILFSHNANRCELKIPMALAGVAKSPKTDTIQLYATQKPMKIFCSATYQSFDLYYFYCRTLALSLSLFNGCAQINITCVHNKSSASSLLVYLIHTFSPSFPWSVSIFRARYVLVK